MNTFNNTANRFTLYAAGLALSAFVIALLAVTIAAGTAQAQTPDKTYPTPQPCGPGAQDAPKNPDATITEGHFAIFDGYWNYTDKTLELNLCPPAVEHTKQKIGRDTVEVSTRAASDVDIRQTVIHIEGEDFKETLTAEILDEYDFFKEGDGADADTDDDAIGKTVWWLKVDDESTPNVDEDSPLAMGYSAALLSTNYWFMEDESRTEVEPLQYEFEVIREPGIPAAEYGHVFAFDDSPAPTQGPHAGIKKADWDSSEVDTNALRLHPGKYHHYQWAFTKPGTYEIWVQLKGHVRQKAPNGVTGWEPISDKAIETSEVRRYVFQIGPLDPNVDPAFEVERSVAENSAAGTKVGDPIPVYQGDEGDRLFFTLSGPGHSLFSVEEDADGNAQVKVASGDLDYEARKQYILTLGVSDKKDFEGNPNDLVDSVVALKINLEDVWEKPVLTLTVDNDNPVSGTTVHFTSSKSGNIPADSEITYHWVEVDRNPGSKQPADGGVKVGGNSRTLSISKGTAGTWTYAIKAEWPNSREAQISSNVVRVTWQ